MSSFKPEGFARKTFVPGSGGGNNRSISPKPYLVEVVDYDLANHTMIARNVEDPYSSVTDIEVSISAESIARNKAKDASRSAVDPARYVGYLIDERMAARIKPGQRVVLEDCVPQRRVQRGDKTYSRFEARWISAIPDPRPNKAFRGIVTLEEYENKASNFQVWEERGLDTQNDYEAIVSYLDEMDKVAAASARGEHPVSLGIQLRAIVQKGTTTIRQGSEEKEVPQYEAINTTTAFSWVSAKRDEAGNKLADGHPLTKDDAVSLIQQYTEYLADEFKDRPDVMYRVEVMPFREFRASQQSKKMILHDRSPMAELARAQTRQSPDDTEVVQGKNFAQRGIIVLSKDKAPQNPGESWEERNFVQDVFLSGFRGHICNFVSSSDGGRVKVHEGLDRINKPNYGGANRTAGQAAPAPQQQAAPVDSGFGDGAADPFGDAFGQDGGDVFAEVISQGQTAAAPAPAPAPAPAAEPAAPAPAPAPAQGGNLFGSPRRV